MARGQGSVVVRIVGEVRDLAAKLRGAGDSVAKFATSSRNVIRGAFDDISSIITSRFGVAGREADKALQSIADSALASGSTVGLGVAAGAAVAAAGLTKLAVDGIRSFVDIASKVRDFQRVSGATAEDASRLVAVMDDMQVDANTGAGAFFRLSRNILRNAEALKADGVAVARNRDGTVDLLDTLLNVADAYKAAGAGAEGNKILFDAFGRSGAALIPILEQGRDRLEEMFAEADAHGEVMSQEDIQKAREFELALDDLGDAVAGLERSIGSGLVPMLTSVADGVTGVVDAVNDVTEPIGGIAGVIDAGVSVAMPALGLLRIGHEGAGDAAKDQADATYQATGALDDFTDSADAAAAAAKDYADDLNDLGNAAFGITAAQDDVSQSLNDLLDDADNAARRRADNAQRYTEAVERAQQRLADTIERANDRIADAEDRVSEAREDAAKINKPGQARDEANERVGEAEKDLARARRDGDRDIADARRDLADASKSVARATDEWEPSLDRATAAGLRNRDRMQEIVERVLATARHMKEQGRSVTEINGYLATELGRITSISERAGFARDATREYLDLLRGAAQLTDPYGVSNLSPEQTKQVLDFLNPIWGSGPRGQIGGGGPVNIQNFYGDIDPVQAGKEVDRWLRRRG